MSNQYNALDLNTLQRKIITDAAQMSAKRRDIKLDIQYYIGKCGYTPTELVNAYKSNTRDGRVDNLFKKVLLGSHIDIELLSTLLNFARIKPVNKPN